jgi:hypothetical protein
MSEPGPATPEEGAPAAVADERQPHKEGVIEGIVNEFTEELSDPEHPLGPFKDPHSTMIAGIEEHVGRIPSWLMMLMIAAVLLAMIMWIPTVY